MAYDQSKLVKDVRIYLGGIDESSLPESIIIYWGDFYDSQEEYEGDYPYILWKTTLCCINYLIANVTTTNSTTANKTTKKEKVGNVEVDFIDDYGSTKDVMETYKALYQDYLDHPEKFGIKLKKDGSVVHIGGVNQDEVDKYRSNPNTTSIYNALPVTAFPKCDTRPWRRRTDTGTYRRR